MQARPDNQDPPFRLDRPTGSRSSLIFASPHSGRDYPAVLLSRSVLSAEALRSSEDAFIDRLFDAAPSHGAPLLSARLPRAWLDVNRAADELDPALIEGQRRGPHNPRVASGLGVVPRVVSGGRPIYSGKLSLAEADARIDAVWRPYHAALEALVAESVAGTGMAILLDCHSMPHEALEHLSGTARGVDVVLGDRFGASADPDITDLVEEEFTRAGFSVARNAPFAGAYVTQHYGRPRLNRHAVQIELDRALYMDEARIEPHGGFSELKSRLDGIVARLCAYGRRETGSLAAE